LRLFTSDGIATVGGYSTSSEDRVWYGGFGRRSGRAEGNGRGNGRWRGLRRVGPRSGHDEARGVTLRQGFDGLGFREYAALSVEQGFDPGAQARPVALRQVELAAQIEQGDLADLLAGAFGGDEAEREVGFVGGFIPRRGFADEHGGEVGLAARVVKGIYIILWHYKVFRKFMPPRRFKWKCDRSLTSTGATIGSSPPP